MLSNDLFRDELYQMNIVKDIYLRIHQKGPVSACDLETLSILKSISSNIFNQFEIDILYSMGLFFKNLKATSALSFAYQIFKDEIHVDTKQILTPVQVDSLKRIEKNENFSFSAPTSTGKSFLFQLLIDKTPGDVIIIAPSRALISEYIIKIKQNAPQNVLVLPFVELVNTKKSIKRIFVITPERARQLFKFIDKLNIQLILFDEAQLSENVGVRGLRFDAFVRRVNKRLPNVKKVFAHPFVENPEAQLEKHKLEVKDNYQCYHQKNVGKLFLFKRKESFFYFSPYEWINKESCVCEIDPIETSLKRDGTCLIFTSKNSIVKSKFLKDYRQYIDLCNPILSDNAREIIKSLKIYFGVDDEKKSLTIAMLEKGIVLHHGSMPLKARFLLEKFINEGHAKICFATSTLIQGINMPFDIVWINNFTFRGNENSKILDLHNLIGRAGRSTLEAKFDYGTVIVNESNMPTFNKRINKKILISNISQLDNDDDECTQDLLDDIDAIKNDSFSDEFNIPQVQVDRLSATTTYSDISFILDHLFTDGNMIKAYQYNRLENKIKVKIKNSLINIFKFHLRRQSLTSGEESVLRASIAILLWSIQSKSFAEILSLRFAYLSNAEERRQLKKRRNLAEISHEVYNQELDKIKIKTSYIARSLPDPSYKKPVALFNHGTSVKKINFDTIVYDTYDYIDKVISLSLREPLCAAFQIYGEAYDDQRALDFVNYLSFGTNERVQIWLLKYGFDAEDVNWISDCIRGVSAEEIVFDDNKIAALSPEQLDIISPFI